MPDKDESSFTVKDKRRFGAEGEPKPEAASGEGGGPEPKQKPPEQAGQKTEPKKESRSAETRAPLPEMNFATLIFSLSSSVLLHLGEFPDPESGEAGQDLPLAKQTIDLLGLLQEKTRGNLDEDEKKLLESVLYDLRLRYVQAVKKAGQRPS